MTPEGAFLQDIIDHLDDSAPRLVFADWLEERDAPGDAERAEFIRVQCRLAALPWDDPERPELRRRETELLAEHGQRWAAPLEKLTRGRAFVRGFVGKVTLNGREFLDRGDELFRLAPVGMVTLNEVDSRTLRRLAASPHLGRLRCLAVHGSLRDAGARALAASPHLGELRGLDLNDNPIGVEGLQAVVESAGLPRLTHLALGACRVGREGVEQLAGSAWSQRLVALDLRGNDLEAPQVRRLAESPHLGNLRRLGLWYNRLRDEGAQVLAGSDLLGRLGHLSAGNNRFGPEGVRALAASPNIANLQALWLGVDTIGDDAALALARSRHLHPRAFVALWFEAGLTTSGRAELTRLMGDRVSLEFEAWEKNVLVDWPTWRP